LFIAYPESLSDRTRHADRMPAAPQNPKTLLCPVAIDRIGEMGCVELRPDAGDGGRELCPCIQHVHPRGSLCCEPRTLISHPRALVATPISSRPKIEKVKFAISCKSLVDRLYLQARKNLT